MLARVHTPYVSASPSSQTGDNSSSAFSFVSGLLLPDSTWEGHVTKATCHEREGLQSDGASEVRTESSTSLSLRQTDKFSVTKYMH